MRLLHTNALEVHEFHGQVIPKYAILSHTWGEEELFFPELQNVKSNESSELEQIIRVSEDQGPLQTWCFGHRATPIHLDRYLLYRQNQQRRAFRDHHPHVPIV